MPATLAAAANARSLDHFTSAAFISLPLANVTPLRSLRVQILPVVSGWNDSAKVGVIAVVSRILLSPTVVTP